MVTSSEDGFVKVWQTKDGSIQRVYNHGHPVNDVVIHPNQGEVIACDRGGNVRIWDLGEDKCTHQLVPEEDISVASVTVASDGSLLCAGNNTVRFSLSPFPSPSILPKHRLLCSARTGPRLRLAHAPKSRPHHHPPSHLFPSPLRLRNPRPPIPRRPPPRHLQRRPQRPYLERGPHLRGPHLGKQGRRQPFPRPRQFCRVQRGSGAHGRLSPRDKSGEPSALGVGLCVQR